MARNCNPRAFATRNPAAARGDSSASTNTEPADRHGYGEPRLLLAVCRRSEQEPVIRLPGRRRRRSAPRYIRQMAQIMRVTRVALAGMLRGHGDDGLADRVASLTDDELTRIRRLGYYYAFSEDALASGGSMGGTWALSLATIDVLEDTGRDSRRHHTDFELACGFSEEPDASERAQDRASTSCRGETAARSEQPNGRTGSASLSASAITKWESSARLVAASTRLLLPDTTSHGTTLVLPVRK